MVRIAAFTCSLLLCFSLAAADSEVNDCSDPSSTCADQTTLLQSNVGAVIQGEGELDSKVDALAATLAEISESGALGSDADSLQEAHVDSLQEQLAEIAKHLAEITNDQPAPGGGGSLDARVDAIAKTFAMILKIIQNYSPPPISGPTTGAPPVAPTTQWPAPTTQAPAATTQWSPPTTQAPAATTQWSPPTTQAPAATTQAPPPTSPAPIAPKLDKFDKKLKDILQKLKDYIKNKR